jgi:hypothetical protein
MMNDININYLFSRWINLESNLKNSVAYSEGKIRIEQITLNENVNCFVMNSLKNEPKLLIKTTESEISRFKINGIDFKIDKMGAVNSDDTFLFIEKKDNISLEAFYSFTVSIFLKLKEESSYLNLQSIIQEVVDEYNDYFNSPKKWFLSKQQEQGLYGELHVLKDLIAKYGDEAIYFWLGPEKNMHDFYLETIDLEVKTNLKVVSNKIRISNENQLTQIQNRNLYLVVINMEENSSIGQDIKDLFAQITDLLKKNESKKVLMQKLSLFKINNDNFSPKYKFVLKGIKNYLINADSSILNLSNLPKAVSNASYDLNLDFFTPIKDFNYE